MGSGYGALDGCGCTARRKYGLGVVLGGAGPVAAPDVTPFRQGTGGGSVEVRGPGLGLWGPAVWSGAVPDLDDAEIGGGFGFCELGGTSHTVRQRFADPEAEPFPAFGGNNAGLAVAIQVDPNIILTAKGFGGSGGGLAVGGSLPSVSWAGG